MIQSNQLIQQEIMKLAGSCFMFSKPELQINFKLYNHTEEIRVYVYFGGYQHAKKDWEKRTTAIVVPFGKSVSQLVARLQEAQRQLVQVINGGRTT
ncbi:hypothetical protein [Acinetobacter sp. V2]|uniref:hypothetical protein n=1 Tax=Acinetobacter sp. V2 TaxID=1051623 RepID=UPI00061E338C|nr:hypothetical protein [Acinetobacter sp. V2]KKC45306.1 hypothetical protein UC75_07435 [Acinetobacter sp. V2]